MVKQELNLSTSVQDATEELQKSEPVSAVALVRELLEIHPEYAGSAASSLQMVERETGGNERPVVEWLKEVRPLFDESLDVLDGRMVIIGLSFLDPFLHSQLREDDLLFALKQELVERNDGTTFDQLLTEEGQKRAPPEEGQKQAPPTNGVPIHSDDPIEDIANDDLGRAMFAEYLALRISDIRESSSRAYSIHIDGPWGSGKSTLLNFLQEYLESDQGELGNREGNQWIVVRFNAWQHQHVQPPWWALVDRVFHECEPLLGPRDRIWERWWRFTRKERLVTYLTIAFSVWLFAGIGFVVNDAGFLFVLTNPLVGLRSLVETTAGLANILAPLVGLFVTLGEVVKWKGSSLPDSAHAAQSYVKYAEDPLTEIRNRFSGLTEKVDRAGGRQVAIFIDDLDRCQSEYAVKLLEGIQTLFRDAPVMFVIAADGRWLKSCFEQEYNSHGEVVEEPGKSLGTLFMEKTFQFSTSIPEIPKQLKEEFWQDLNRVKAESTNGRSTETDELQNQEEQASDTSYETDKDRRRTAVKELATPRAMKRTETMLLERFGELIEPNPRAMKRLVNTYSANQALVILSDLDIGPDQLALWTILSLRWPKMAAELEANPKIVQEIGQKDVTELIDDEDLQRLYEEEGAVEDLIHGNVEGDDRGEQISGLTPSVVDNCAKLRSRA